MEIGAERARQLKRDLIRHTVFVAVFLAVIFMQSNSNFYVNNFQGTFTRAQQWIGLFELLWLINKSVCFVTSYNSRSCTSTVPENISRRRTSRRISRCNYIYPHWRCKYLLGVLTPALTQSLSYSGRSNHISSYLWLDLSIGERFFVQNENRIVGAVRFRYGFHFIQIL